jgi:hypothetical protein
MSKLYIDGKLVGTQEKYRTLRGDINGAHGRFVILSSQGGRLVVEFLQPVGMPPTTEPAIMAAFCGKSIVVFRLPGVRLTGFVTSIMPAEVCPNGLLRTFTFQLTAPVEFVCDHDVPDGFDFCPACAREAMRGVNMANPWGR